MTVDLTELGPLANADFGDLTLYAPAIGPPISIPGIFDNAYVELVMSGDAPPATSIYPILGVNLADFPSPPLQGDRLTLVTGIYAGRTFVVREVRPDSHGWAILPLNRVSA
jgi:hypothetical protein